MKTQSELRLRVAAAFERLGDEIATAIEDQIRHEDEWVDQNSSPLGKRGHLEAVRGGYLQASKSGKRVFVRRADLDKYLRAHAIKPLAKAAPPAPPVANEDEERIYDAQLKRLGLVRVTSGK